MKAYKVEVFIIDHDEVGEQGIKEVIEATKYPNYCISPEVKNIVGVDIGEWDDDHVLNNHETADAEYKRLFGPKKELCDCGKVGVWCYMPSSSRFNPYCCDDCVPRGCSCNQNSISEEYDNAPEGVEGVDYKWINKTTWTRIDEKGREYPCVEYDYDEDGWELEND